METSGTKHQPEAVPKSAVVANQATVFGIPSPGGRGSGEGEREIYSGQFGSSSNGRIDVAPFPLIIPAFSPRRRWAKPRARIAWNSRNHPTAFRSHSSKRLRCVGAYSRRLLLRTPPHSRDLESIRIVTGPSFTSHTFMSAPNVPVWMGRPKSSVSFWMKDS